MILILFGLFLFCPKVWAENFICSDKAGNFTGYYTSVDPTTVNKENCVRVSPSNFSLVENLVKSRDARTLKVDLALPQPLVLKTQGELDAMALADAALVKEGELKRIDDLNLYPSEILKALEKVTGGGISASAIAEQVKKDNGWVASEVEPQ